MDRRQFMRYSAVCGASFAWGSLLSFCKQTSKVWANDKTLLKDLKIIDAHAHPDRYVFDSRSQIDVTSTVKAIKTLGMVASSFAAVGDMTYLTSGPVPGTDYSCTKTQLEWWIKNLVRKGKIKLILKASDIPDSVSPDSPSGAILSIEGGDPLGGKPDRVNEFYHLGVRIITLIHYRNNEIGDVMKNWRNFDPGPMNHGLTQAGRKVVERMQDLGVMIDVAHAHSMTLKQIVEMTSKPLIDSHTSPCPDQNPSRCGRFRTWEEMEWVAKTGGVICTWPFAYKWGNIVRRTFLDWAREILEMKKRLGIEHVGLGTDGGGHIPKLIDGYRDVCDLVHLISAMEEVGFTREEIGAYMGGNFYRVFRSCIG